MSDSRPNDKPNNKRKRKKTVLMNARKYVKKGNFGRGTYIEEDTCRYFVSILETLREGVDDNEAKQNMANNVFDVVKGKEMDYSSNQIGCRVIEEILPMASPEVLESFSEVLSKDLRPICSDQYASHVIEKLVQVTAIRATEHLQETKVATYSENHVEYCRTFALKISKFLLNNLEDFVMNTYSNFIIRTCIMCLSGLQKPSNEKKNFQGLNQSFRVVPEEWSEIAIEYCQRLSSWPQFFDFPNAEITSGMLQVMLSSLSISDEPLQQKLIKKLVKKCFPKQSKDGDAEESAEANKLPPVFDSQPFVRFFEVSILLANEENFAYIYKKCFKNNLRALSLTRSSNFSVQKLLDCCKSKEHFELIINELTSSFKDILASGHSGVLVALVKASRRLVCQQGLYVKSISSALNCEDSNNSYKLAALTARLLPLERAEQATTLFVNVHGSVILQEMLHFNKPIKIVNSLLAMSTNDIVALFCDPKGCHIADAFFESAFIGEKSREKMCRTLKGTFQQLAINKYGSRVLERIWDKVDKSQQTRIMNELASKSGLLEATDFGKGISNKYNVELYKRSTEDWEKYILKTNKINDMFSDIIKDTK